MNDKLKNIIQNECDHTNEILKKLSLENEQDFVYFHSENSVKRGDYTLTLHVVFRHNTKVASALKINGWKYGKTYNSDGGLSFYSTDLFNDSHGLNEILLRTETPIKMSRYSKILHTEPSNFGIPSDQH